MAACSCARNYPTMLYLCCALFFPACFPVALSTKQGKDSWNEAQDITVDSLPGRKLHVRAGQYAKLVPALQSFSIRGEAGTRNSSDTSKRSRQYLIRTSNPLPAGIYEQIKLAAGGNHVQYIPEVCFWTQKKMKFHVSLTTE